MASVAQRRGGVAAAFWLRQAAGENAPARGLVFWSVGY